MNTENPFSGSNPPLLPGVAEVKYSLPELLREAKAELDAEAFAMEKLDQKEINRLFNKGAARGKPGK